MNNWVEFTSRVWDLEAMKSTEWIRFCGNDDVGFGSGNGMKWEDEEESGSCFGRMIRRMGCVPL